MNLTMVMGAVTRTKQGNRSAATAIPTMFTKVLTGTMFDLIKKGFKSLSCLNCFACVDYFGENDTRRLGLNTSLKGVP